MRRALLFVLCWLLMSPGVWAGASRNFDGSTDEISLGNIFNYSGTTNFSISAWISSDTIPDASGDAAIFMRFTPGVSGSWGFRLEEVLTNTFTLVCYREVTPFNVVGATTLDPSIWYHIACVYNGTSMTGYFNGTSDAGPTSMGSIASTSINDRIGGNNGTTQNFNGQISNLRIWNRVLSIVEINEERFIPGNVAGSQQLWSPLFGTASPEQDLSGNGRTGTLTGTTESGNGPPVMFGGGLPL